MYFVRAAAAAMNTSGDEMISKPPEWCSPIHTSWNPMRSRCSINSRSRSSASVGFCPVGWNGAMKSPKRIGPFDTRLDRSVNLTGNLAPCVLPLPVVVLSWSKTSPIRYWAPATSWSP